MSLVSCIPVFCLMYRWSIWGRKMTNLSLVFVFVSCTGGTHEEGRHDMTCLRSFVFCLMYRSNICGRKAWNEEFVSGLLSFVSCTDGTHEEGRHDMVFLSFVSCTDLTYEEGRHETRNLSPVFVFCLMTDGTYEERRHDWTLTWTHQVCKRQSVIGLAWGMEDEHWLGHTKSVNISLAWGTEDEHWLGHTLSVHVSLSYFVCLWLIGLVQPILNMCKSVCHTLSVSELRVCVCV